MAIYKFDVSTMGTAALGGNTVSSVLYDPSSDSAYTLFETAAGGFELRRYNEASGTPVESYVITGDVAPPHVDGGLSSSNITYGQLAWGSGTDLCYVDLRLGAVQEFIGVLPGTISAKTQIYDSRSRALFCFIGTTPYIIYIGRVGAGSYAGATPLSGVIADICDKTGMESDEYDVSSLSDEHQVRGYIVSRPSTGRAALEKLLLAHFVDGIETDFTVKFVDRSIAPVRTITEDALGSISSPTGNVSIIETRKPEHDVPAELNIVYQDPARDYQQGSASFRRVSLPTPAMYSQAVENIEFPMVLEEATARDLTQRLLYLTWLSRDESKTKISWTNLDLDPGDVVNFSFDSGRVLTDRIGKITVGADFTMEMDAVRSGDPVYTSAVQLPLVSSNIPTNTVTLPVYSNLFVLDLPLIEDYHDMSRTAQRFYTVIGAANDNWRSAALFRSPGGITYTNFGQATVDATWGDVMGYLPRPRVVGALDNSVTVTVRLTVDNGDVASTTFANLIEDPTLNRALIWNKQTGIGEIFQFQTATVNGDGTVTLSNLIRGLRGTDYAVNRHTDGEVFMLLNEQSTNTHVNPLAVLGSTEYLKAVSAGTLLAATNPVKATWIARDLRPYAPSQTNRAASGSDVVFTWNRRTRVNGEWNMYSTIEELPLNEDIESYTFWLLPNDVDAVYNLDVFDPTTYSLMRENLAGATTTITAAELTAAGYTSPATETIYVAVCQNSAQVGYGFIASGGLNP